MFGREGSTVLLSCALGEGQGQWVKDGRLPIPADKGRVWLHNVSHTHEGEYTCSYGEQSRHYYLTLQGESPPAPYRECVVMSVTL